MCMCVHAVCVSMHVCAEECLCKVVCVCVRECVCACIPDYVYVYMSIGI